MEKPQTDISKLCYGIETTFPSLGVDATVFTLQNRCKDTIWPGILTGAGKPQLIEDDGLS
ncbi:hypothetical protein CR513_53786, partial [Mucuna pruriens]